MKKNKITIEWHFLLKDILRNIWVVILSAFIGYMGVYLVSHSTYKPEYTSVATVAVVAYSNSSGSYSTLGIAKDMANVISNVFTEPTVKEYATEHLDIDSFDGTISATVLTETNFIEVKVTSDHPKKAYELLSAVLAVHYKVTNEIFSGVSVIPIRTPEVPNGPSNRIADENTNLAVAACATISLAVIVILSLLKDTVKKEKEFNERIDSKLIGTIAHEDKNMTLQEIKQKKKKGLLIHSNAYISLRFTENFHKIAAKLEYEKNKTGDKIFAITSVAENEGKSTCAANIAVSLTDRGNKVVLVDLDGKKPAIYKLFNEEFVEESELSALLNKEINLNDFKFRTFKKTSLFLAINTKSNADYQKWIADGSISELLSNLKKDFDYVIVDTAPLSLDSNVTDIIKEVDKTILIIRTNTVSVSVLNDFISTISKISSNLAGCILNDVYMNILPFSFTGNDESNYYGYKHGKYSRYGHYGNYGKYFTHKEEKELPEALATEFLEEAEMQEVKSLAEEAAEETAEESAEETKENAEDESEEEAVEEIKEEAAENESVKKETVSEETSGKKSKKSRLSMKLSKQILNIERKNKR